MEAVWELLDACVAGPRLQTSPAEKVPGDSVGGDDDGTQRRPQVRWYDARYRARLLSQN